MAATFEGERGVRYMLVVLLDVEFDQLTHRCDGVERVQEVFVGWLMQRLPYKGAKEIEEMLLGKLPDIRNTRSGQDLMAIGIEQGKLVGQVQLLESLCNSIPTEEAQLRSMSVEQLKSRLNDLKNIFDARHP